MNNVGITQSSTPISDISQSELLSKSQKFDSILYVVFLIALDRMGVLQDNALIRSDMLKSNAQAQGKINDEFTQDKYVHIASDATEADINEANTANEEVAASNQSRQNSLSTLRLTAQGDLTTLSTLVNFLQQHNAALTWIMNSLKTSAASVAEVNQPLA